MELTPRQNKIVKMRSEGKTYRDIGEEFDITSERVRQIYVKAIKLWKNQNVKWICVEEN